MYQSFVPSQLWNADIQETKANCNQCIQAPHKYDSDLKCCTFWPFIPNYIVGQILQSKEQKYHLVKIVIQNHISQRQFNLPMGMVAPVEYQINFKRRKSKVFGKDESFLCPYYDKKSNNCGAWLYRGSVCTSFFCESSYGKKGQGFWHNFENYLSYLEMGLSQEVLAYKDFSPKDVNQQLEFFNVENKIKWTLPLYKKLWKHFYKKEIDFYIQAADFIQNMPKSQTKEILGETGESIKKELINSFERIHN